jgi:hypothetical protein
LLPCTPLRLASGWQGSVSSLNFIITFCGINQIYFLSSLVKFE